MQGHGEYPLSDLGISQAEKLGRRLLEEDCLPSFVYTSPLKRTVQTTEILLEQVQASALPAEISDLINSPPAGNSPHPKRIPVERTDEIAEFQNGIFQGLTWPEARQQYPDLCRRLESTQDWIQIPEAESLDAARARAKRFIQRVVQKHRNGDRLWIVTHSWILQHLIAELMGCDRSWRLWAANTALFEFWIDRSRWFKDDHNRFNTDLWQVRRFNDYQHLRH
jgi:broad specificity phosphatase PhoE